MKEKLNEMNIAVQRQENGVADNNVSASSGQDEIARKLEEMRLDFSEKMENLQSLLEQQKRASALASVLLLPFAKLLQGASFLFYSIRHPKKSWQEIRQYWYIRRTGQFDPFFYLRNNSDVAENFMNPLYHYCRFGWRENRDPAPWFSTSFYLEQYPDVMKSGLNPFYHWLRMGQKESRVLSNMTGKKNAANGSSNVFSAARVLRAEFTEIDTPMDSEQLDDIARRIRKGLYEYVEEK